MSDFSGKTIGQYQLVEIIDETGTALVYKGFQPSMNRYVAVKVLKPGAAGDPASVQQFTQKSELAAQMQHSNVLPVYDSGQEEGVYYRVSRYVETGTLRDRLSEFYDPRKALGLVSGLVEALEYIHAQGYVHGNLKPSNIFLDEEGRPLLTDFGFPQQPGTAPTPYLSPEQVQGGAVDRRADVYALGVLLYEMLVGTAPPAGASVSPRTQRPDLVEAVERVILKSMAQNPEARFQSASEFRNALDAALRPVAPPPQPAQYQQPPTAPPQAPARKGTNWLVIILGILLVIVVCAFGVVVVGPRLLGEETSTPVTEATEAPPEVVPPTEAPPEPPTEAPPEQPPEEQPPEEPPSGEGPERPPIELPPIELPPQCSSTGIILGAVVLGSVGAVRRRKRFK